MPSSQTLYSITITNGNAGVSPNDGFVDNRQIQNYTADLISAPAGYTFATCEAKARANFRYHDIIMQLGMVGNCYVTEMVSNDDPNITEDATATTEATSFQFYIIVEHGDASLITADEYNPGQYLTGTACLQRCVGRALLNDSIRTVAVFDPTDSATAGNTASVTRFGTRVISGFEIGPYATNISNANANVAVAKITF